MELKLPEFLKNLFWDTDTKNIDIRRDHWFVIERVVNLGDDKARNWLLTNFRSSDITDNLYNNYNISTSVINAWGMSLGIDPTKCKCMLRPSLLRAFD